MNDDTPGPGDAPQILPRDNGSSIAYHATPGNGPGVIFMTGFKSDMEGSKALALEAFCRQREQAFLRFDYTGHGQSSGQFTDGCIGDWAWDAVEALDSLTEGPQILVGSSMGGWIMLLAALARPDRVAGLVGIAAAPDFTEDLLPDELSDNQWAKMMRDGQVDLPSPYDEEPTPITRKLVEDGRDMLLLRDDIELHCPVRLIHGKRDEDVPWATSLRIAERLKTTDVEVLLVKDGDHRMSEPQDIDRLCRVVDDLLTLVEEEPMTE
ncbi:carboxylesterase [Magnetospira sp. QH-2]|uniref:alpha/beta hydrolase n=1 Tax=Magnetospira sp. (strain QH-2) TaxID=1288970 RepID=UPI0003E80A49|nr:alpha/beta hydrolase [Magnetospira sp. QH-2]CCQ72075.1 protein of the alpha/beta hydrolase superfamily [Magnetospira sp. QH-2]